MEANPWKDQSLLLFFTIFHLFVSLSACQGVLLRPFHDALLILVWEAGGSLQY